MCIYLLWTPETQNSTASPKEGGWGRRARGLYERILLWNFNCGFRCIDFSGTFKKTSPQVSTRNSNFWAYEFFIRLPRWRLSSLFNPLMKVYTSLLRWDFLVKFNRGKKAEERESTTLRWGSFYEKVRKTKTDCFN